MAGPIGVRGWLGAAATELARRQRELDQNRRLLDLPAGTAD